MSENNLLQTLTAIVGKSHVITNDRKSEFYRTGFRSGGGGALAVVLPASLLQLWRVLEACVASDKIIIMQAANTGLTEGSAPSGEGYDRDIVIVNVTRIDQILLLAGGDQIISFSGATLHSLEKKLKPLKRAPHSVIGSSCIGASIVGGVANNSGGALVKRGPAYTELALFAQLNAKGELELVNHLGIDGLGDIPEEILNNLEAGRFSDKDIRDVNQAASDRDYEQRIRDIDASSPSRYNADKDRLYEASGCAGKLAVFAVRLDTFAVAKKEQVFYIGTNDPAKLAQLRRDILSNFKNLPETAEYMHRDCFDVAQKYGKDTFLMIHHLGTDFMPGLFAFKARLDATLNKLSFLPNFLLDRLLQFACRFLPQHLPKRLLAFRDQYEHHLILKMSDAGIAEAEDYLEQVFCSGVNGESTGGSIDESIGESGFFACTEQEAKKAFLHRFAAAGAAMRYQIMHHKSCGEVLALDIALKRNERDWVDQLPTGIQDQIVSALYYGHFLCHVFHQDYILSKDADPKALKAALLEVLEQRGAKYPAEHNVGHLYKAENDLAEFYQKLDPTNSFNPGIGKCSKQKRVI